MKITRIPNILTILRIALIPVIVALFYASSDRALLWAFGLYALAALTDYLDGWFARKFKAVSALGRFLDPIADKLLIATLLLLLTSFGRITGLHVIGAIIILLREMMVADLRGYLGMMNVPIPVSKLSKWKTAVQMIALGLLIVMPMVTVWPMVFEIFTLTLFWVAVILTAITGCDYLKSGLKHIRAA